MKKRIFCVGVLLILVVVMWQVGNADTNTKGRFTSGRGKIIYPSAELREEIANAEQIIYLDEETFSENAKLAGLPSDLLEELQGYVVREELGKAIEAYDEVKEWALRDVIEKRIHIHEEFAVFSNEENKYFAVYIEKDYRNNTRELCLQQFVLNESDESGEYLLESAGKSTIVKVPVLVKPHYVYLNRKNELSGMVKSYVEDNLWLFVYRNSRGKQIWGDEKIAVLSKESKEAVWENANNGKYGSVNSFVVADYNNDGTEDLFFRKAEYQDARIIQMEDGMFQQVRGNLADTRKFYEAEQLWFINISGKTVTFQLLSNRMDDELVLAAYVVEGKNAIPLLTCQVEYGYEMEMRPSVLYEYEKAPVDILDYIYVANNTEQPQLQEAWWKENIETQQPEERTEYHYSVNEEAYTIPQELFGFLKEDAYSLWCNEESRCLREYEEPLITELEEIEKLPFMEELGWDYFPYMIQAVFQGESTDGMPYYLTFMDTMGSSGSVFVEQYSNAGEAYDVETIWQGVRGEYCGVITYDGITYLVEEMIDYVNYVSRGLVLLPIDEAGEFGESFAFFIEPKVELYESRLIYKGDLPEVVAEYVQVNLNDMLAVCAEGQAYYGADEIQAFSDEQQRIVRNLTNGYSTLESYKDEEGYKYVLVDINNDGVTEYVNYRTWWAAHPGDGMGLSTKIYNNSNGEFRELYLQGQTGDWERYSNIVQSWFEEIDGTTYLFTVNRLYGSDDYVLSVHLIQGSDFETLAVYFLQAGYEATYAEYFP